MILHSPVSVSPNAGSLIGVTVNIGKWCLLLHSPVFVPQSWVCIARIIVKNCMLTVASDFTYPWLSQGWVCDGYNSRTDNAAESDITLPCLSLFEGLVCKGDNDCREGSEGFDANFER